MFPYAPIRLPIYNQGMSDTTSPGLGGDKHAEHSGMEPALGGDLANRYAPLDENRVAWVEALARIGRAEARQRLLVTAANGTTEARIAASNALGRLKDSDAVSVLLDNIDDDDPAIRASAVRALGRIADAESLPNLLGATLDDHPSVREAAARALGNMGVGASEDAHLRQRVAQGLSSLLSDDDKDTRQAAVAMLGWVGGQEAASVLISAMFHPHSDVSHSATMVGQWMSEGPYRQRPFELVQRNQLNQSALPLVDFLTRQSFPSVQLLLWVTFVLGTASLTALTAAFLSNPLRRMPLLTPLLGITVVTWYTLPLIVGWWAMRVTEREQRGSRYALLRRMDIPKIELAWSYTLIALHRGRILIALMFALMPAAVIAIVTDGVHFQASQPSAESAGMIIQDAILWTMMIVHGLGISVMSGGMLSGITLWSDGRDRHVRFGLLLIIFFLQGFMLTLFLIPEIAFPQVESLLAFRLMLMAAPYLIAAWFVFMARKRA